MLAYSPEHGRALFYAPVRISSPSFSIIVCTRNRSTRLAACLDALVAAMKAAPGVKAELIVVDNASTDETPDVLLTWLKRQDVYAFAVHAPQPGLSRARNIGLARASGDVIVMTDDDCIMEPDYLIQATKCHIRRYLVGGKVTLGDPMDAPVSIRLGNEPQVYDGRRKPSGFVIGANMTFHRDIVGEIGGFDERLGAGTKLPAGEDSDFVFRAWRAGFPVSYDPRLVVRHFHGRRDAAEVQRLVDGYAYADGGLYRKHMLTGWPLRYMAQAAKMGRWKTLRRVALGMLASR